MSIVYQAHGVPYVNTELGHMVYHVQAITSLLWSCFLIIYYLTSQVTLTEVKIDYHGQ